MPETARIETIEGKRTLVTKSRPPLPQKLDGLLSSLTHVTYRIDMRPTGTATSCELREHRFARFREGRHVGTDGIVRDLRLEMCRDCGAVAVRDVSFDYLDAPLHDERGRVVGHERARVAATGPSRRNFVLGWYSGKRRSGRIYTGG